MENVIQHMVAISRERRPVWKIILSNLEGYLGTWLFRKLPPRQGPRRLNLGCGTTRFQDFVNADYYRFSDVIRGKSNLPDWMLDASKTWKCPNDYWEGIFTEHTLEHLDYLQVVTCLKECFRTLKPGAYLRIVLPGYRAAISNTSYPYLALAVGYLTQTHGHTSVWDADLLCALLNEIGFVDAKECSFKQGSDSKLLLDLPERKLDSFYVEAKRP